MKPSNADSLPDFKEAIPSAQMMDTRGTYLLSVAIILSAAKDYYDVVNHPRMPIYGNPEKATYNDLMRKEYIEYFLKTELFDSICEMSPDFFIRKVKELKDSGKDFPKVGDYMPVGNEISIQMIHGNGKVRPGRTANVISGLHSLI